MTLEYGNSDNVFSMEAKDLVNENENLLDQKDSFTDLIKLQQQCPDFRHIYSILASGDVPDDPRLRKNLEIQKEYYQFLDGVLIHLFQNRAKKKPSDDFGIKKTFCAIQAKYFWPHMYQEISDHIRSCNTCQRVKRDPNATTIPLNPLPVVGPFERLHMDIIGPLTKTSEGHVYILVCVCSFTCWVEAFPLKTQSASEIAMVLHDEIFSRYGVSKTIVTDRGRNFV